MLNEYIPVLFEVAGRALWPVADEKLFPSFVVFCSSQHHGRRPEQARCSAFFEQAKETRKKAYDEGVRNEQREKIPRSAGGTTEGNATNRNS